MYFFCCLHGDGLIIGGGGGGGGHRWAGELVSGSLRYYKLIMFLNIFSAHI